MLPESVIAVRDALKKQNRPISLFFDNNQRVESMTDVISWNDDLKVLHVVRTTQEPLLQHSKGVEVLTFGYEDIRSISEFIGPDEISEVFTALTGVGATEFSAERAQKLVKYFTEVLEDQSKSKY